MRKVQIPTNERDFVSFLFFFKTDRLVSALFSPAGTHNENQSGLELPEISLLLLPKW